MRMRQTGSKMPWIIWPSSRESVTYFMRFASTGLIVHSVLDLSYNNLREVPKALQHLTSLKTVYFVQNKISEISGLGSVGATLRSLELGSNRIRACSNLIDASHYAHFKISLFVSSSGNKKLGCACQPRGIVAW